MYVTHQIKACPKKKKKNGINHFFLTKWNTVTIFFNLKKSKINKNNNTLPKN